MDEDEWMTDEDEGEWIADEHEGEWMQEEEEENFPKEVIFNLGTDVVSSLELDQLLSSKDLKDKERLRSIVVLATTNERYSFISHLLNEGYELEVINDKNQTVIHLAYNGNTHPFNFWGSNTLFTSFKNFSDCNGLSHLHIACAIGHVDVVKQFLDNGEDIRGRLTSDCKGDKRGFTPLHFAVAHHQIKVVELLLEKGADVDAVDSSGSTPLHLASAVSWIFKKSTDIDSLIDSDCWDSDLSILELLLKNKSNLNARDNNGNTPLLRIFKNNYYYYPSDVDEKVVSNPLKTDKLALYLRAHQLRKFTILFERDADITVKNNDDESILHCVISDLESTRWSNLPLFKFIHDNMHAEIIRLLLQKNKYLDVNAKNSKSVTPIGLAVSIVSFDIVKRLLDYNVDLNNIDIRDHTFFRYPNTIPSMDTVLNLISIVSLLLNKGFNLTLGANLTIMKFLVHDVDDCDCGNVSHTDLLTLQGTHLISHSSSFHMKQVFMSMCESFDGKWKACLLLCFRIFLECCKSIPYQISMDDEILKIVHEISDSFVNKDEFQSLLQPCKEHVNVLKSITLKNGVSLYDILTKYSHSLNTIEHLECNDVIFDHLRQPYSGHIFCGHVKKLKVRTYVASAAYNDYVSLVLPVLPDLCRKMVLDYLNSEDILRLCTAALLE